MVVKNRLPKIILKRSKTMQSIASDKNHLSFGGLVVVISRATRVQLRVHRDTVPIVVPILPNLVRACILAGPCHGSFEFCDFPFESAPCTSESIVWVDQRVPLPFGRLPPQWPFVRTPSNDARLLRWRHYHSPGYDTERKGWTPYTAVSDSTTIAWWISWLWIWGGGVVPALWVAGAEWFHETRPSRPRSRGDLLPPKDDRPIYIHDAIQ